MKPLRIGLIGYGFMGRTHSNAFTQVKNFFDLEYQPVLKAVCAGMEEGAWERLKTCANGRCGWAFYDRSKNRSGRWCSMDVCGNRAKTRAYRSRTSTRVP